MVFRQARRQVDRRGAVHRAEGEVAHRFAPLHRRARLLLQGEQPRGVVQQDLAGRRQLQALAFAEEQVDAKLFLQLPQARRQVRRHPVQALGGAGDGAFLGDRLEDPQLAELHG
ncbi:hypothetical protein BN889_01498 [Pseudomonas aeruginosa PA38182]|nr:hypothetical protein BN889_01498 [Pseudomonas aeruginosa PA38182]